jgi:Leucine-rich repeat (LRR) protein
VIFLIVTRVNGLEAQDTGAKIYNWDEISGCNPDTIFGLSLEKLKMDTIPMELSAFKNLRFLNLGKNRLSELPDFIGEMKSLEVLDLSKNEFSIFPIPICRLEKLRKLIVNRNQFESIPDCIKYCKELEEIDLWDTPIGGFPEGFYSLINLKVIDLTGLRFGPSFQERLIEQFPNTNITMEPPCNCMK